jgi:hypothetical protein
MTYEFLPEAREELFHAALYYEARESGLGIRFRNEVALTIDCILRNPALWREREGGYRRVNLPIFPYYVAFFICGDVIIIAAVAHGSP